MNGFKKWLSSTKFQVSILGIILVYLTLPLFHSSPKNVIDAIVAIVGIFCGGRVAEPLVEGMVKRFITKDKEVKRTDYPEKAED